MFVADLKTLMAVQHRSPQDIDVQQAHEAHARDSDPAGWPISVNFHQLLDRYLTNSGLPIGINIRP